MRIFKNLEKKYKANDFQASEAQMRPIDNKIN